jgi:hypothetical protein
MGNKNNKIDIISYFLETNGVYQLPPPRYNAVTITDLLYMPNYPLPNPNSYKYFFVLNKSLKPVKVQYGKENPFSVLPGHSSVFSNSNEKWVMEKDFPNIITTYAKGSEMSREILRNVPGGTYVLENENDFLYMFFIALFFIFLIYLFKKI